MGFHGSDQGSSPQTQGYCAPTEKARRADADSRARRVHAALAKPALPAWVAAEFRELDFDAAAQAASSNVLLSPAALAHRQRAAKLSLGFRCQILEQLAEERGRLADRLQSLAAACDDAVATHSTLGSSSGGTSPRAASSPVVGSSQDRASSRGYKQQLGKATARSASAAGAAPVPRLRTAAPLTAADLERTPRRPRTPATAARPTAAAVTVTAAVGPFVAAAAVAASASAELQRPSSWSPSSALRRPTAAAAASASRASTPTRAVHAPRLTTGGPTGRSATPPPTESTGPPAARRRLSFVDDTIGLRKAVTTPADATSSAAIKENRAWSPTTLRGAVVSSSWRASAAAAWGAFGVVSEALAEATRAAAAGRRLAATAALGVMEGALGVYEGADALVEVEATTWEGAAGASPRVLAWQDPVGLLPQGCLQRFADARDGLWPRSREPYTVRKTELVNEEASHLGHRERLRVGMAELNAELYSSWRALVDSGAV